MKTNPTIKLLQRVQHFLETAGDFTPDEARWLLDDVARAAAPEPETDSQVVAPVVHLNGTGKGELLRQRHEFYEALYEAGEKLRLMGPNGRDYYVEPGRCEKALAQHERRQATLRELMEEIETEIRALDAA